MLSVNSIRRILGLELVFVLLWNSGFIGAEYGLAHAGPWTFLFWRHTFLGLGLFLWQILSGRWQWRGFKIVGLSAIIGILAHGVWLTCVLVALDMKVPAGLVALITSLQPLLTGALSKVVLGERTPIRQWVGLILGFLGVGIAVGARLSMEALHAPAVGYLIPFGSVIGLTVASLLQRRWARTQIKHKLPLDETLFYQVSATAVVLLAPAWWLEGLSVSWTPSFIGAMSWLVVAVSFGAYWTMWRLLEHKQATYVASLFYLSPPVTMFMAWIAFGDALVLTDFLGLVIAACGVLLVCRAGSSES